MSESIKAVLIVMTLFAAIYSVGTAILRYSNLKKAKKIFLALQEQLVPGKKVLMTSGIIGILRENRNNVLRIEIADNVIISCTYYSVQSIVKDSD